MLSFYTGNKDELQQKLALIEGLTKQADQLAEKVKKVGVPKPPKKPAEGSDPPHDRGCRTCRSDSSSTRPIACVRVAVAVSSRCQVVTSEMIDLAEVSYPVVQVEQQKYVCKCGAASETAPGPERAAPGSRYSLALAIKVVLDKYLDHIPLERQARIMDRHGLVITSRTLWELANALAHRLSVSTRRSSITCSHSR